MSRKNGNGIESRETDLEARINEIEAREDAINSLRQFRVTRPDGRESLTVFAHRQGVGPEGTLLFYVDTDDGMYCRRVIKTWDDCEEIVTPDNNLSASFNN